MRGSIARLGPRLRTPLIKLDMQVSRIQLSDKALHMAWFTRSHTNGCDVKSFGAGTARAVRSGRRPGIVSDPDFSRRQAKAGSDLEDNVSMACAEVAGLDAIVTRDPRGFAGSTIPVLSPAQRLALLSKDEPSDTDTIPSQTKPPIDDEPGI